MLEEPLLMVRMWLSLPITLLSATPYREAVPVEDLSLIEQKGWVQYFSTRRKVWCRGRSFLSVSGPPT